MLRVAMIASGKDYQEAAAWAAPTYARQLPVAESVSVLVPEQEDAVELLKAHSEKFQFSIQRFPFCTVSKHKFTSQLKCQAFWFAVSQLQPGELLFIVDSDTYCRRPLTLRPELEAAILEGKIGLAPDIEDRHFKMPADPWYLSPLERTTYVNSGVVVTSKQSLRLFQTFRELSEQPQFLCGPFNDQKVINFALGKHFRDKLVLLDVAYNAICNRVSDETIIGHCTGGAGYLGQQSRKNTHREACVGLLKNGGSYGERMKSGALEALKP